MIDDHHEQIREKIEALQPAQFWSQKCIEQTWTLRLPPKFSHPLAPAERCSSRRWWVECVAIKISELLGGEWWLAAPSQKNWLIKQAFQSHQGTEQCQVKHHINYIVIFSTIKSNMEENIRSSQPQACVSIKKYKKLNEQLVGSSAPPISQPSQGKINTWGAGRTVPVVPR